MRRISLLVAMLLLATAVAWAAAPNEPKLADKKLAAKTDPNAAADPEDVATAASPLAAPDETPIREAPITNDDREHWSFRPLGRPAVPQVNNTEGVINEIDRFIVARLEREGLHPQPPADRLTLLRRVTFDLTGLPPSVEDSASFSSDDAYAALVDRLLASPAYAERWGQHWLDLARFAETDGFEHDKVRNAAWKYRDWVIDALGRDMPVDQFIQWQMAGDELRPDDPQALVATGFLLAGPDMPDLNLKEERRHNVLNEITSSVGAVFLGLQMGCAQCHDHKYDPISQADFYRLRAVFEPAELFKANEVGRVVVESGKAPVSRLIIRGDFRRPGAVVEAAFPRIANISQTRIVPSSDETKNSGRRTALARWLTSRDQPLTTRVLMNWVWQQHFGQGLSRSPGDFGVMGHSPSHPELLDWLATELMARRWSLKQMHKLIVTSAAYRQASRPESPEWNAATASAAVADFEHAVKADPENKLLARANRCRLDGEAIRDAMLASADRLNRETGGPGVMVPLPKELLGTLLKGQWKEDPDVDQHRRRSVYLFVRRNLRYPLFEAFDRPDTNASCPRRNVSTTAPQALVLLNSEFSLSAARDLASYIARQGGDDPAARIKLLYQRTLGRLPSDGELAAAEKFLALSPAPTGTTSTPPRTVAPLPDTKEAAEQESRGEDVNSTALVRLCLAMFNLNEFVYVD